VIELPTSLAPFIQPRESLSRLGAPSLLTSTEHPLELDSMTNIPNLPQLSHFLLSSDSQSTQEGTQEAPAICDLASMGTNPYTSSSSLSLHGSSTSSDSQTTSRAEENLRLQRNLERLRTRNAETEAENSRLWGIQSEIRADLGEIDAALEAVLFNEAGGCHMPGKLHDKLSQISEVLRSLRKKLW
jgi:hypothetical protein